MEDKNREYENLLRELLESRQYTKLRQTCADMQTADIAAVMDDMEDEESLKIFRIGCPAVPEGSPSSDDFFLSDPSPITQA